MTRSQPGTCRRQSWVLRLAAAVLVPGALLAACSSSGTPAASGSGASSSVGSVAVGGGSGSTGTHTSLCPLYTIQQASSLTGIPLTKQLDSDPAFVRTCFYSTADPAGGSVEFHLFIPSTGEAPLHFIQRTPHSQPVSGLGDGAVRDDQGIQVAFGKYVYAGSVFLPHIMPDVAEAEAIARVVLQKLSAGG